MNEIHKDRVLNFTLLKTIYNFKKLNFCFCFFWTFFVRMVHRHCMVMVAKVTHGVEKI